MFSPNSKTVQNVQNAMMMVPFFLTNLWFYDVDLINLNFAHQTLNLTKSIVNVGPEMLGFSLCVCLDRCGWVMISKFLILLSGESTAVQQQREGADA